MIDDNVIRVTAGRYLEVLCKLTNFTDEILSPKPYPHDQTSVFDTSKLENIDTFK